MLDTFRFVIRNLLPTDIEAALLLNNANVPAVNELDLAELTRLIGIAEVSLTAEIDGAFAGFCIVLAPGADYASLNYRWFSQHYSDFVYLDRIAVDSNARRYGLGRAFYAELVTRFTGTFPQLFCEVNIRPRNDASLDFHHSLGFREIGQQDTDGGTKTVSLLSLQLP